MIPTLQDQKSRIKKTFNIKNYDSYKSGVGNSSMLVDKYNARRAL